MAISIPIFTSQLEKSREAVDLANLRAAYAEIAAESLLNDQTTTTKTVNLKQTQTGWLTSGDKICGEIDLASATSAKQGTAVVSWVATSQTDTSEAGHVQIVIGNTTLPAASGTGTGE